MSLRRSLRFSLLASTNFQANFLSGRRDGISARETIIALSGLIDFLIEVHWACTCVPVREAEQMERKGEVQKRETY